MLEEIAEQRDALIALCHRYHVARLDIFGSAAHGTQFNPANSDVDLLVSFAPTVRNDLVTFEAFREALESLLKRQVDLVEREAVERSRNFIRRRAILSGTEPIYG